MLHSPSTSYSQTDRVSFEGELLAVIEDPFVVRVFSESFLDASYGAGDVVFGDGRNRDDHGRNEVLLDERPWLGRQLSEMMAT